MKQYKPSDSKFWYVSYTDSNGKRIKRSLKTESRKVAKALVAKLEQELFLQENFEKKPEYLFNEALERFKRSVSSQKKSADSDEYRGKTLLRIFSDVPLSQISPKLISDFIDLRRSEDIKESTIIRELALLKAILNRALKEWEWIDKTPYFPKLKDPPHRENWLPQERWQELIDACELEHTKLMVSLALYTGGRLGEIQKLQWNNVSFEARKIYYVETKSGKSRGITISHKILPMLKELHGKVDGKGYVVTCKGRPITSNITKSFKRACNKLDLVDFRFHDLRHSFASSLAQKGMSPQVIKELLGHSSIAMAQRYSHLRPDNMSAAVDLL